MTYKTDWEWPYEPQLAWKTALEYACAPLVLLALCVLWVILRRSSGE